MNQMLLFIFLNSVLFSCSSLKSDTTQITECYSKCQSSIVNKDGRNAIDYISIRTVNAYSALLEKVIRFDSAEVNQEKFTVKLFILKTRHLLRPEVILRMDGRELLIFAINSGMSNNNNIGKIKLKAVTKTDSCATASLIIGNKEGPLVYKFWKEDEVWKIELHTQTPLPYQILFPDATISENEYINDNLEKYSGIKPSPALWHPVQ